MRSSAGFGKRNAQADARKSGERLHRSPLRPKFGRSSELQMPGISAGSLTKAGDVAARKDAHRGEIEDPTSTQAEWGEEESAAICEVKAAPPGPLIRKPVSSQADIPGPITTGTEKLTKNTEDHRMSGALKTAVCANQEMLDALIECQEVLAMLTDPERIKESRVHVAWARAVAAEAKARAAIGKARVTGN